MKRAKLQMAGLLSETARINKIHELLHRAIDKYDTFTGLAIYDSTGVVQLRDLKLKEKRADLQEEYYKFAGYLLKLGFQDIGQMKPGVGAYKGPIADDLGAAKYMQIETRECQFGIMPLDEHGLFVLVGICSNPGKYISTAFRSVLELIWADVRAELA